MELVQSVECLGYRLDSRGIGVQCQAGADIFSAKRADLLWGWPSLLRNAFFKLQLHGSEFEADHSALMSRLIFSGGVHPHPLTSSWHGSYLSIGTNLIFTFTFGSAYQWAFGSNPWQMKFRAFVRADRKTSGLVLPCRLLYLRFQRHLPSVLVNLALGAFCAQVSRVMSRASCQKSNTPSCTSRCSYSVTPTDTFRSPQTGGIWMLMTACLAYIQISVSSVGSAYNITLQKIVIVQLLTRVNNEVRTFPFIKSNDNS